MNSPVFGSVRCVSRFDGLLWAVAATAGFGLLLGYAALQGLRLL